MYNFFCLPPSIPSSVLESLEMLDVGQQLYVNVSKSFLCSSFFSLFVLLVCFLFCFVVVFVFVCIFAKGKLKSLYLVILLLLDT